jgi:hypothetical protein
VEQALLGISLEKKEIKRVFEIYGTGIQGVDADWLLENLLY